MLKISLTIVLLTSLFLSSCDESEPPFQHISNIDTIQPLSYFPAWPGSFWIYSNGDTLRTSTDYSLFVYNRASFTSPPDIDSLYLPELLLNGVYNRPDSVAYLKAYELTTAEDSYYRDGAFRVLLDTLQDTNFYIGASEAGYAPQGRCMTVDTSLTIGNDQYEFVIYCIHYDATAMSDLGLNYAEAATVKEFYARDVGLIKRLWRSNLFVDFSDSLYLVEYSIAP